MSHTDKAKRSALKAIEALDLGYPGVAALLLQGALDAARQAAHEQVLTAVRKEPS